MKKTILTLLCGLVFSLAGNAQGYETTPFAKDKFYVGANFSGLDLNWSKQNKWNLSVGAKVGYLFDDNFMITANADYNALHADYNTLTAGAGLRYYFDQCGVFIGAGCNYAHATQGPRYDDFLPTVQAGYALFLNRTVAIEPEVYYNHSFKCSDYSGLGFRIGFSIYFE